MWDVFLFASSKGFVQLDMIGWIMIALGLILIGYVLRLKGNDVNSEMESKVYSTRSREDDQKLYELTVLMRIQAAQVKRAENDGRVTSVAGHGIELANAVDEFLKVSGWSR